MNISLFEFREKHDKFILSFGISLLFIGILFLILWRESYFLELSGQIAIQLGISIIVIDLLIAKLGNKLQQKTIKSILIDILGISENKKLISELNYINKPTGYQVIEFIEKDKMIYAQKRNEVYNMKINEYRKVTIDIKKDNSHYCFDRAFDGMGKEDMKILFLKVNKQELDVTNKRDVVSYFDEIEKRMYFKVVRQLEQGKVYTIEYETEYPACMSDLNFGDIIKDSISTRFIELTERAEITYIFPFDITRYNTFLKRKDMTEFKYEPIPIENITKNKNEIIVTATNLRNNDTIVMYYLKKD